MLKHFISRIEIWEAFPTGPSGEDILMHVYHCVDPFLAELINEFLHFIQVGLVVNPWRSLDSFPHDSQSDQVESPSD